MKKLLTLMMMSLFLMTACGNSEVEKINDLVIQATEKTQNATTAEEVAAIATELQTQMDNIAAESGDKISFGKDVDEALSKYNEVAAAKLLEFGIVLE